MSPRIQYSKGAKRAANAVRTARRPEARATKTVFMLHSAFLPVIVRSQAILPLSSMNRQRSVVISFSSQERNIDDKEQQVAQE